MGSARVAPIRVTSEVPKLSREVAGISLIPILESCKEKLFEFGKTCNVRLIVS